MSRVWICGLIAIMLFVLSVSSALSFLDTSDSFDPKQGLELYVGWASDGGMTKYAFEAQGNGLFTQTFYGEKYGSYNSLYIGGCLPIQVSDMGVFRLGASITLPATCEGEELISLGQPTPYHYRNWTEDTIWNTLEGVFALDLGGGASAMAGFRWDNWQTSFKSPKNAFMPGSSAPTDTNDLTMNSFLPLVGIMTSTRGLTFGVMGFPVVFGNIEFHSAQVGATGWRAEAKDSFGKEYFVELFLEWAPPSVSLLDGVTADFTIFSKFSALRDVSSFPMSEVQLPAAIQTDTFDFVFERRMFVIGAKASLLFNLPSSLASIW